MVAVETLYLTALLSAFIGLIALFVLSRPEIQKSIQSRSFLASLAIIAAVVSAGSFLFYAISPHESARSVYGAGVERPARL